MEENMEEPYTPEVAAFLKTNFGKRVFLEIENNMHQEFDAEMEEVYEEAYQILLEQRNKLVQCKKSLCEELAKNVK